METTTLSSKGQIVIPKRIRTEHRWAAGQDFDVVETNEGILLRPWPIFPPSRVEDIGTTLNYGGSRVSVEKLSIGDLPYRDPYRDDPYKDESDDRS